YSKFNGMAWTPWTTVPGTGSGTQTRRFISGYPRAVAGRIGLIWTEGTTTFDVVAAALDTDITAPSVSITAPADGATVSGTSVAVAATATDDVAVAGVQFLLDGQPLGAEVTQAPYAASWDTTGASRSVHTLAARAPDAANNQTTSAIVTVTLADPPVDTTAPTVTATPPPGTFTAPQSVVLVPSEQPVTIYYTL